jgi:hypothetical protein
MNSLEVKTNKAFIGAAIVLGLFLIPLVILSLIDGIKRGRILFPLVLGVVLLILFGCVVCIARTGHSKSVRYFSSEGLVRNDGRSLSWNDLSRILTQIRIRGIRRRIWRIEIQFKNGETAWIIPRKISNYREVIDYMDSLPCEHTSNRV